MLINMTMNEFLTETASSSPAPGGGSVSALVGALGAALTLMVCELTTGKDDSDLTRLAATKAEASRLQEELKQMVDRDTVVFNKVMAAYKMPKASDAEKQVRSASIQETLKAAAEEPFRAAAMCLEVMNAASDAAVAGLMAYAALHGALYNVRINISAVKDDAYTATMRDRSQALADEADRILANLKKMAAEIIG